MVEAIGDSGVHQPAAWIETAMFINAENVWTALFRIMEASEDNEDLRILIHPYMTESDSHFDNQYIV